MRRSLISLAAESAKIAVWLFGGYGYDSAGSLGELNDLWKYSPTTGMWTWVGSPDTAGGSAVYGTLGVAAVANIPGAREEVAIWTLATAMFGCSEERDAPTRSSTICIPFNENRCRAWISGSRRCRSFAARKQIPKFLHLRRAVDRTIGVTRRQHAFRRSAGFVVPRG